MRQPIREGGIENHLQPVDRYDATADDFEALRRLHPTVGRENPRRRDQRAKRHHDRREEMQARANLVPAEQHDTEEASFQEEGRQHFVGQKRPGDTAGKGREIAPVSAELIGHDEAGDDAHTEVDSKDLRPKVIEVAVDGLLPPQPHAFEHRQIAGKPNGDRRKDDVEGNSEAKLNTRHLKSRQTKHFCPLLISPPDSKPLNSDRLFLFPR